MSRPIKHAQSHASLLHDVSAAAVPPKRSRLDAIVVPTARPASSLQNIINLSASLSVPLVILCSRQAKVEQVAQRVAKTFAARATVVGVPEEDYELPCGAQLTSAEDFRAASFERSSDLSLKRNIGLLLGRLRGWKKILFVDDDISQLRQLHVERLSSVLDRQPVASMASREFPDNSVVCHARRLAGLAQDVFVSGAVLGVNLRDPELSFFPDIYNEDWFFFAGHAAGRSLSKVGEVRQAEYLPYDDPGRARREEFGDLLAEGLYALFESTRGCDFDEHLAVASRPSHWRNFKATRLAMIQDTALGVSAARSKPGAKNDPELKDAQNSLRAANDQHSKITPELCVQFIQEWQQDERRWQKLLQGYTTARSERDALSELGLSDWVSCGYGEPLARHVQASGAKPKTDLRSSGPVDEQLPVASRAKSKALINGARRRVVLDGPNKPGSDFRLRVDQVPQDRAQPSPAITQRA